MAFDYDPTLATSKDWIRFRLQDTEATTAIFQDEEIEALIATERSREWAAFRLAQTAAMRYARKANRSIGDISLQYQDLARSLNDAAAVLETEAREGMIGGPVFEPPVGQEPLHEPIFSIGMHDLDDNDGLRVQTDGEVLIEGGEP